MLEVVDRRFHCQLLATHCDECLILLVFPLGPAEVARIRQGVDLRQVIQAGPVCRAVKPSVEARRAEIGIPGLSGLDQRRRTPPCARNRTAGWTPAIGGTSLHPSAPRSEHRSPVSPAAARVILSDAHLAVKWETMRNANWERKATPKGETRRSELRFAANIARFYVTANNRITTLTKVHASHFPRQLPQETNTMVDGPEKWGSGEACQVHQPMASRTEALCVAMSMRSPQGSRPQSLGELPSCTGLPSSPVRRRDSANTAFHSNLEAHLGRMAFSASQAKTERKSVPPWLLTEISSGRSTAESTTCGAAGSLTAELTDTGVGLCSMGWRCRLQLSNRTVGHHVGWSSPRPPVQLDGPK